MGRHPRRLGAARRVALLIDANHADGPVTSSAAGFVADVRNAFPEVHVLGYCRAGAEHSSAICALVRAGADDLIFRGIDDSPVLLRSAMRSARIVRVGLSVLQRAQKEVPRSLHALVALAIDSPRLAQDVSSAASNIGSSRRALAKQCARAGVPGPAELITWCRLLVVTTLLSTTRQTVRAIADDLEFHSDTSLRNLLRRYTGLTSLQIRSAGGDELVWQRFRSAVASRTRDHAASVARDMHVHGGERA